MSAVQKGAVNQSQKLMVFVLTMALYGLATFFTELIPSFQVGVVEFSVEYFLFIPLTLAMLFDPLSAALGAATGELVFSEIMLGQFVRNRTAAFHGNGRGYSESTAGCFGL